MIFYTRPNQRPTPTSTRCYITQPCACSIHARSMMFRSISRSPACSIVPSCAHFIYCALCAVLRSISPNNNGQRPRTTSTCRCIYQLCTLHASPPSNGAPNANNQDHNIGGNWGQQQQRRGGVPKVFSIRQPHDLLNLVMQDENLSVG